MGIVRDNITTDDSLIFFLLHLCSEPSAWRSIPPAFLQAGFAVNLPVPDFIIEED